jgi:hypothetical protein
MTVLVIKAINQEAHAAGATFAAEPAGSPRQEQLA